MSPDSETPGRVVWQHPEPLLALQPGDIITVSIEGDEPVECEVVDAAGGSISIKPTSS